MLRRTSIVLGLLPQPALAAGDGDAEIFAVLGAAIFGSLAMVVGYLLGRFVNLVRAVLIVSIIVLSFATWLWSSNAIERIPNLVAASSVWFVVLVAVCLGIFIGLEAPRPLRDARELKQ